MTSPDGWVLPEGWGVPPSNQPFSLRPTPVNSYTSGARRYRQNNNELSHAFPAQTHDHSMVDGVWYQMSQQQQQLQPFHPNQLHQSHQAQQQLVLHSNPLERNTEETKQFQRPPVSSPSLPPNKQADHLSHSNNLICESATVLMSLLQKHESELFNSQGTTGLEPPCDIDQSILQRQTLSALREFLLSRRREGAAGDELLAIEMLLRSLAGDSEFQSDCGSLDGKSSFMPLDPINESCRDVQEVFTNILPASVGSFHYVQRAMEQEKANRADQGRRQRGPPTSSNAAAASMDSHQEGKQHKPPRRCLSESYDNVSPASSYRRQVLQSPPQTCNENNVMTPTTTTSDGAGVPGTPRVELGQIKRAVVHAGRSSSVLQSEGHRTTVPGWYLAQGDSNDYGNYLSRPPNIPPYELSMRVPIDVADVHQSQFPSWTGQTPEEFGFLTGADTEESNSEHRRLFYGDDRDRMVYVSWIPKKARAYTAGDKRKMELDLKRRLREDLALTGLCKVLLFPPKGVHCKLIFDSRQNASLFMQSYGGDNGSKESEQWKEHLCRAYEIHMNDKFSKTLVKIEWSQK